MFTGVGAWLLLKGGALFGALAKLPPWVLIIAVSASLNLFLWHNASGWKAKAETCAVHRKNDLATIQAATKRVTDAAIRLKVAREAHDEMIRKEYDAKLSTAIDTGNGRLTDYIRAHRVQPHIAGNNSSADLSQGTNSSQVDLGSGEATILVSANDLSICTENTERLINAHDEAAKLQEFPPVQRE